MLFWRREIYRWVNLVTGKIANLYLQKIETKDDKFEYCDVWNGQTRNWLREVVGKIRPSDMSRVC
ncbi:hypothetical protein RH08_03690 [Candidatus Liberibacter asiaticus]|uniref:Uncharacterized protein n=2 Tax=Liberibacter asiaticus TaxID=34021 RepID=C6XG21_LIBAP|nr:hypothetical protein CLIBASIA_03730 [Candidatus Liberibacter asiaticus str. psy62]AGH17088.1 hypothetical protein WSI_03590 [Candidatus Liberibacter asiaticus str. gxpsy]ALK07409.1 hypothetical protein CD16_03650 [Candidatus Liberibacter asiaticus]BAP26610.1 hypothetical protein CGUJ_03730 [Candidatus Liberibacter asiaticus str. Ishi-1]ASK52899.1 hypothetical protein B2I23_03700 [Candidatus Liberibacter asiaticus]